MEAEIGAAAGRIRHRLAEKGETTVARLKQDLELPEPVLLMALGWLAREGKIDLSRDRRVLKIALRPGPAG